VSVKTSNCDPGKAIIDRVWLARVVGDRSFDACAAVFCLSLPEKGYVPRQKSGGAAADFAGSAFAPPRGLALAASSCVSRRPYSCSSSSWWSRWVSSASLV
jgi:hypothetical protein